MKKIFSILLPLFFFCGTLHAADGFEAVKCGADIPQALLGKKMSNEPVVAIEARHKDLGLKDLGASEISDTMDAVSWQICGKEYILLEVHSVVRDVLLFPPHSKSTPAFDGICEKKGAKMKEEVMAVLQNQPGGDSLPAEQAWMIDQKTAKFIKISAEDLRCPRSGIITLDGGR